MISRGFIFENEIKSYTGENYFTVVAFSGVKRDFPSAPMSQLSVDKV